MYIYIYMYLCIYAYIHIYLCGRYLYLLSGPPTGFGTLRHQGFTTPADGSDWNRGTKTGTGPLPWMDPLILKGWVFMCMYTYIYIIYIYIYGETIVMIIFHGQDNDIWLPSGNLL